MTKKIVDIDLATLSVREQEAPEDLRRLGGRGLTSTLIQRETDPLCHPLAPENLLVIAPGLLAGTGLSSANRLSAGAKSPLTGGIKESNSGGTAAFKLARLGIAALKFRGAAPRGQCLGVHVSREGFRFEDLGFAAGLGTYAAAEELRRRFGARVGLILAGPAGEMRMSTACLNVTDPEGEPCRNLGRGGLGAVAGAKGLKALIIDDAGAQFQPQDPEGTKELIRRFAVLLKEHPITGEKFPKFGTAMTLMNVDKLGGLPTRNFSAGSFEKAEALSGETLYQTISGRGGQYAHGCMPGCVIRCSNKYVDAAGKPVVGSLDFETIGLLGANLALSELDQVAELNRLCNDIGIDTMETGVALGVLAEGGLFRFGDFPRIRELIQEVGRGTPLGRLIASGAVACGRAYGLTRVPAVKGQSMAAYDPRVVKGMGLTYALSPMGADHTAGNAITLAVDPMDPRVQLEPVRELHLKYTAMDCLGLCIFTGRVSLASPELIEQAVNAIAGWPASWAELLELGRTVLRREREFNRRAGFTATHDRLPEFMLREQLPPNKSVFDVPQADLDRFYDFESENHTP
jgi:aldehyde:ferredoxin oxidoreductase